MKSFQTISRHRSIVLAAAAAAAATGIFSNRADADTLNYVPTGNGQWLTPANWLDAQTSANRVPTAGDIAVFPSTVANGSSVTLNFSTGNIYAGAIQDTRGTASSGANSILTLAGNTPAGGSLYLTGETVTVPFNSVTTTETYPNVIIASTSTSTSQNKDLTFNSSVNMVLNGSSNTILGYSGQGSSSKVNNSAMPIITISGNISDGSVSSGLTFLGGGNIGGAGNASAPAAVGGELNLGGVNTFTGGLTIGTPNGAQGGTVELLTPTALPTTGTITVYEGAQLAFVAGSNSSAPTVYGGPNQTLVLNGIGEEKTISGAIRPTGGTAAFPIEWAGNISLGSSVAGDLDNGYVLTTVASAGSDFKVLGNITGPSTGGLIEQGGGLLELAGAANNYGATQIGNGGLTVDVGASISPGDLWLFQTSTNDPLITLNNTAPTVGNLRDNFTATNSSGIVLNSGGFVQSIILNGLTPNSTTTLTINQTTSQVFGYGAVLALTSGIADGSTLTGVGVTPVTGAAGAVVYNGASGAVLTLSGPNSYTGGTTIKAGTLSIANLVPGNNATDSTSLSHNSALGSGNVVVMNGATLATGGFTAPIGFSGSSQTAPVAVTSGALSGILQVSSGGIVTPGSGSAGTLYVGGLNAAAGSVFNLYVGSALPGNYSTIVSAGAVNLDPSGNETINITGSTLAVGSFNLVSGVISGSHYFTKGTTPNGLHRSYTLSYNTSTNVEVLNIINTGTERDFSTTGSSPAVDGSGTFGQGATNFYQSSNGVVTNNATYNNADNYDTAFGDGGTGGLITVLSGGARVGGVLILGPLQSGRYYTFGSAGSTNAITTVGGLFANNSSLINAPVILGGSQTYSVGTGNTVALTGGVSESVTGSQLTLTGGGTLALNGGTGSWTGGTNISGGTLQTTTAALPATGAITNNGSLVFDQQVAGTTGTVNGLIAGTGTVTVQDTGTVTLNNSSNSYTGQTTLSGGTLAINNIGDLGAGTGGILLNGGTLLANANLAFPASTQSPKVFLTLASGTSSTVNTSGHAITFGQLITGAGNINVIGGGSVTLTGVPSTTVIGQVAVGTGTQFVIAPPSLTPSFGFSFSGSPGTVLGNIVVATPIELRLEGGLLDGGGNLVIQPAGMLTVAKVSTTISGGSGIVLPSNIPGNSESIGSASGQVFTIDGVISGASAVDFTSGNATSNLLLGANNTYTGSTTVDQPVTLSINNGLPTTTDVTVTGSGLFELNGYNQSISSLTSTKAGSIVQNSGSNNSVLTVTGTSSTTFVGSIQNLTSSGTLGLTLNGTGSLALSNISSYAGPLNILGGRLQITIADPTQGTGLGDASVINIGGGANASNAQLEFNGVGSATDTATISYNVPTIFNITTPVINLNSLGGYNTGTGVNTGAVRVSGSSFINIPNNIVFNANSAVTVTGTSQLTLSGNLSGTGTFISNGNGLTTVTGANPGYTGGTEVDAGTLNIASGSVIGSGPLTVTNTLNSTAGSTGNATTVNFLNGGQTVGSLSGAITPASSGTNTAVINLPNSATLTVNQTTDGVYAGTLNGAGANLIKTGPNALTIGGAETYTGTTNVSAGTLTIAANPGTTMFNQVSGGITIGAGAKLALAVNTTHDTRTLLITPSPVLVSSTSTLDLGDNDLDVPGGSLAVLTAEVAQGYNLTHGGNWSGAGITSSAAAANSSHLTALGTIQNNQDGSVVFPAGYDGSAVGASDIIIKYTYFGDANLDGKVDGSDYSLIDAGYASHGTLTGWYNGDFNYDRVIDGSDYALIDNAFNNQGQSLSAAALVASETAQVAGTVDAAPQSAVPEPAIAALAAIGTAFLAGRARRRK